MVAAVAAVAVAVAVSLAVVVAVLQVGKHSESSSRVITSLAIKLKCTAY